MKDIKGTTRVCCLIGNPVAHSISPFIHNTLAKLRGDDLVYVTCKVEEDKVLEAVKGAYALNVLGMNVTVPHKQQVLQGLSEIDPMAEAIGAVNTLVRTKKGGYKGYNTDILGLERQLQDADIQLNGRSVVILGAGGAARAIAFLCGQAGVAELFILNRTLSKAESIAAAVNAYFHKSVARAMDIMDYVHIQEKGYIVIQTTSVGLHPHDDEVIIDDAVFYQNAAAGVDIIYNPSVTKFMKLMQQQGKPAYNGLKMLLYQGIAAYELWLDCSISKEMTAQVYDRMKKEMDSMRRQKNIILIGFMGCGKTTCGEWIAKNKQYDFIDTDAYIVDKEKRSIQEIFEQEGEPYFRELETLVLKELLESAGTVQRVFSVGGGLPVTEANRPLLKQLGQVVYLRTSIDELERRLKKDTTRPLLKGGSVREKIEALMTKRKEIYEQTADIIIDTDGKEIVQIYEEITGDKRTEY